MIIKPPSLTEKYTHVYSSDSALDPERDGYGDAYQRFLDTGDMAHLEPFLREGQAVTTWELKPIQGRGKRLLRKLVAQSFDKDGNCTDPEILWVASALGLVGVDGLHDDRGKAVTLVWHRDPETKLKCVTDESMDVLESIDNGMLVNELGYRVLHQMHPSPD